MCFECAMQKEKLVWGLTGGIACGKSTVAKLFEKRGWKIIDADAIAHALMAPGEKNWKLIVDSFGKSILKANSEIDRAALAAKVFRNPSDLHRLNQITHPAICETCVSLIHQHQKNPASCPLLVVVPLLYEIGFIDPWKAVLAVGASLSTQKQRLFKRGLDIQEIEDRLASQWPVIEKINRARYLLWNDGSLEILEQQIDQFIQHI